MSGPAGFAAEQLRSFVERLERLQEEIDSINEDKKDVYAEAKGNGFDVRIIREVLKIRRQDKSEREEREAVLDLYLQALGMSFGPADPDDEPAPRAPARTKEQAIKVGVSARMSLQKELISEAEALGLMRPEVAEENRRLADAVATKYGAGTDAEVPFA